MISRSRVNVGLYALALVLACGCVFGGVLAYQVHRDRSRDAADQERYGDVLVAATDEAEAFINIRYDDARASIDAVATGATGKFRKQYDTKTKGVISVLQQNRSVMDGKVLWAGVVDLDSDSATVIAATTGTVANRSTNDKPVAREFRLQLQMVRDGDRWLTDDLEFVG